MRFRIRALALVALPAVVANGCEGPAAIPACGDQVEITLDAGEQLELMVGATRRVTATVQGCGPGFRELQWTSGNPDVARVNPARGDTTRVVAVAPGRAIIFASSPFVDARALLHVQVRSMPLAPEAFSAASGSCAGDHCGNRAP